MKAYFTSFSGLIVRGVDPQWVDDPLSMEGARLYGGRFNPKGKPALYTSLAGSTVLKETRFVSAPTAKTLYKLDLTSERLIDLRPGRLLDQEGMLADYSGPWRLKAMRGEKPEGHILYEKIIAVGGDGLITPSYAEDADQMDVNIVLFRTHRTADDTFALSVLNPETLANSKSNHNKSVVSKDYAFLGEFLAAEFGIALTPIELREFAKNGTLPSKILSSSAGPLEEERKLALKRIIEKSRQALERRRNKK